MMPAMDHDAAALDADCHPTPLDALLGDTTPVGSHFLRSHFGVPRISAADYTLEVTGLVTRPVRWRLDDLRKLSHVARTVTLECAGHRRTELDPPAAGVPWALGAVGHARWAGGSLADLLSIVRPLPEATHIVFHGADAGPCEGRDAPEPFSRALPLRDPVVQDAILAWEMNGRALEPEHGYPVRLIAPGWYAVSSIKWLTRIELIAGPFDGFFQAVDYRLREEGEDGPGRELTVMPVHSLVVAPADGAEVAAGTVRVEGVAWGGTGGIARVDVQVDDGDWQMARIDPGPGLHAPTRFSLDVELAPGAHVLRSRAKDRDGAVQPDATPWNQRGYGVHHVHTSRVRAV
jgi:DMSO/TMAO reductase YedYZ molybdopterin-dependent catalytic subunit